MVLIDEIQEVVREAAMLFADREAVARIKEKGACNYVTAVDGTTNLVHDYQNSTISLALLSDGEAIVGIVYDPYSNEMYYAQKSKGSYCNGKEIQYIYACF